MFLLYICSPTTYETKQKRYTAVKGIQPPTVRCSAFC